MVDTLPPHTPYPRWEVTGTATEGYITINVMQSGNIDVKQEYKFGDNTLLKTLQAISTYVKQEPSTDMDTSSDPVHSTPSAAATHSSAQSTATEEAKRGQTNYRFSSEAFADNGERIACQITVYLKELSAFAYNTDSKTNTGVADSPKAWTVRVDEPPMSELWPEHSLKIPKVENDWDEENLNETEDMDQEMEDMEQEQSQNDDLSDDDEEDDEEGEDIDRFRQLVLESKIDPSQLALLKGLPVMTLDTLIARRDFSEADMKKLIGNGDSGKRRNVTKSPNPYKNSKDPWLKPLAFTCNKCGQKFEKIGEQEHHEAQCTIEGVKCTECDEMFGSVSSLGKHMDTRHSDLIWSCKFCSDKFSRKKFLMTHVRTAHDERPFQCMKCDKKFESEQNLKIHEKMHDKKKKHRCEICGNFYSSSTALNTHMELHTMKEKPFKCDKCTSAFYNKHQLKSHIKMVHEEPSKCKICHAPLRGAPAVIRKHMLNVHGAKYMYECNVCDKEFEALYELNAHKKSHTQSFQCTICGKVFAHKRNYIQHMKRHSGTPTYKCDECGEMFVTNDAKCKHVKNKHSMEKKFHCDICGKSFKSSEVFKHHQEIHENEKKYVCKLCGKGFNSPGSIWKHRAVHERQGIKNVGLYCSAKLTADPASHE